MKAFLIHLRLHYQLLVLSGGYLLGGLFSPELQLENFLLQFFNVHVMLNGGITAYNSYWDKDEGPIGGIKAPPKLPAWSHPASIIWQLIGLGLAYQQGTIFIGLYLSTMVLSVAYSSRRFRWKGHPWLSLLAVGTGTGTNTFLMGALAAGASFDSFLALAAIGTALLLLSLYPVSQIFQIEEDLKNGDRTFAAIYGIKGTQRFYLSLYPTGLVIASGVLYNYRPGLALVFLAAGSLGFVLNWIQLRSLKGDVSEYEQVMRLKYGASFSFTLFLWACIYSIS